MKVFEVVDKDGATIEFAPTKKAATAAVEREGDGARFVARFVPVRSAAALCEFLTSYAGGAGATP